MRKALLKQIAEQAQQLRASFDLLKQELGRLTIEKSVGVWRIDHYLANIEAISMGPKEKFANKAK